MLHPSIKPPQTNLSDKQYPLDRKGTKSELLEDTPTWFRIGSGREYFLFWMLLFSPWSTGPADTSISQIWSTHCLYGHFMLRGSWPALVRAPNREEKTLCCPFYSVHYLLHHGLSATAIVEGTLVLSKECLLVESAYKPSFLTEVHLFLEEQKARNLYFSDSGCQSLGSLFRF